MTREDERSRREKDGKWSEYEIWYRARGDGSKRDIIRKGYIEERWERRGRVGGRDWRAREGRLTTNIYSPCQMYLKG